MLLNQIGNWETWDPFGEMDHLKHNRNHLFPNFQVDRSQKDFPQFNVWEDNDGLLMTSELPGVKPEDLDIVATGDVLTVKGSKKVLEMGEKDSFLKRELTYGNFSRSVKLPYRINPDKVEAKLRNGILTVTLSRPEEEKPKNITITNN